jgi:hypothetical protein
MTTTQVQTLPGGGKRVDLHGLHLIRVRGTAYERARMHGALLKEEIQEGALPYLSQKNESLIRSASGLLRFSPVQKIAVEAYHQLLLRVMGLSTDPQIKQQLQGLCEGAGIPYEMTFRGAHQAEGLMMLSRLSMMKYLLGRLSTRGGLSGCSSAVALGAMTQSGRLLAARNQDYPVVGPWEKHTTVLFQEPTEVGLLPVVSVVTAGVHTGGLTSMNREGMTLFTHAHFGRQVSLRGRTVVDLGSEIIEKSRTIGEAIDIARKNRRYANWAYVVSSAKENQAVVLEMTPDRVEVREAHDGVLTHSNFFQSPAHAGQEALLSGAYSEDLVARICSLRKHLFANRGSLVPEDLAVALGDPTDPDTGVERIVGNTVGVVTTIKSTVFDPLEQRFWVSTRGASPQGLDADFLELQADRFWDQVEGEWESRFIHGYRPSSPKLIEATAAYREAYRAWHMDALNPARGQNALQELQRATEIYPEEGNVWVQRGMVEFVLRSFEAAAASFQAALRQKLTPHVQGVADLFLGRCQDLGGNRNAAIQAYHAGLGKVSEPRLRSALESGLRKPYRSSQIGSIQLDFQFPDTFQY